jgi:glycosyltransferase involved in cell wall biosynthesis
MADPTHVSLTVCLEELLKNDQTASRMGQKARETILNQYSISHIAQQYAGLYYHLMTI